MTPTNPETKPTPPTPSPSTPGPQPVLLPRLTPSQKNSRFSRYVNHFLNFGGWFLTLLLAGFMLLRFCWFDQCIELIWFNAYTFYLYLPIYLVLGWAIKKRRRWLLTFSLVIATVHFVWIFPELKDGLRAITLGSPDLSLEASVSKSSTSERLTSQALVSETPAKNPVEKKTAYSLKIFYANVYSKNPYKKEMFLEATAADPDLIIFNEYLWPWSAAQKKHATMFAAYRYRCSSKILSEAGILILSKQPIVVVNEHFGIGAFNLGIDLTTSQGNLRLYVLHSPRPAKKSLRHSYLDYWKKTLPLLAAEPHPLLLIGDFNSTPHSRIYHQLCQTNGLHDLHKLCGRAHAVTWPNSQSLIIPPIRIDHAFITSELRPISIKEGVGHGSDHKPLLLEIGFTE